MIVYLQREFGLISSAKKWFKSRKFRRAKNKMQRAEQKSQQAKENFEGAVQKETERLTGERDKAQQELNDFTNQYGKKPESEVNSGDGEKKNWWNKWGKTTAIARGAAGTGIGVHSALSRKDD